MLAEATTFAVMGRFMLLTCGQRRIVPLRFECEAQSQNLRWCKRFDTKRMKMRGTFGNGTVSDVSS